MNKSEIEALNQQFAIREDHSRLRIEQGPGSLPVIYIENAQATASIALQGAHLLSWVPQGEKAVIWVSRHARFQPGKSVRGGVPICWPWFGAHESEADFPAHGFARLVNWQVDETGVAGDGSTIIRFSLQTPASMRHLWPFDTRVEYSITVGKSLQLNLSTHNESSKNVTIGQALHAYFSVSDVSQVVVHGLENTMYLDKLENFSKKQQQGAVTIESEVDRVYLDTADTCIIEDPGMRRRITIEKQGSHSTVVWNPGQLVAKKMGDLGPDGYRKMLCVESCNAANDVVVIPPRASHRLQVIYRLV